MNAPAQTHSRYSFGNAFFYATWFRLRELLTNPLMLFFSLFFPVFLYFMFGTNSNYADLPLKYGNVSASILISMTTYGALSAVSSTCLNLVLEQNRGWNRQVALTRLGVTGWMLANMLAAAMVSALVVVVSFLAGYFAVAKFTGLTWLWAGLAIWGCSLIAAPLAFAVVMWFRSDNVFGLAGGLISIFAFVSGMFLPIESMGKFMQNIAPYMPFYSLNRIPVSFVRGIDALKWWDLGSLVIWIAVFLLIALLGSRRSVKR